MAGSRLQTLSPLQGPPIAYVGRLFELRCRRLGGYPFRAADLPPCNLDDLGILESVIQSKTRSMRIV
jgi:hypothetical protein